MVITALRSRPGRTFVKDFSSAGSRRSRTRYFAEKSETFDAENEPWTLDQFKAFLTKVIDGLNSLGYALALPQEKRLATLATKVGEGYFWGEW